MILKSFKYIVPGWTLDSLTLSEANLIVGKNSAGKSRALDALNRVISLISQKIAVDNIRGFKTELVFSDDADEIGLSLEIGNRKVIRETLVLNGEFIIERDEENASINGETVNPPVDMLLMHVRRDVEKYPVIEKIIAWSEEGIIRSFIDRYNPSREELYDIVSEFTPEMIKHVIEMANYVGFPLTEFNTFENLFQDLKKSNETNTDLEKVRLILINEKNVGSVMFLGDLSSGMHRTISLLVLIEQLINLNHPALIAIDDLGEGLDYSRATKVGRLLFDICEKHGIQLIATSNEEFMMNIVDINQWNILVRKGEFVRSITAAGYHDVFEEFKFSGLDNFDFFTSDFLARISLNLFPEEE